MKRLLTEREVQEIYGLNPSTLQKHRHLGTGLPYTKIGKRCFYLPEDIEAAINAGRCTAVSTGV